MSHYKILSLRALMFIATLVALTLVVFWPGLSGHYLFDDVGNLSALGKYGGIQNLETLRLFVFEGISTSLGRPLSMLSFTIDGQNWPADPAAFKYTNVMLHVLNAVMILGFVKTTLKMAGFGDSRSLNIAFFGALLWAIHPIQISTVLYVVQRMAELVTFFILAGLWTYVRGRRTATVAPRAGYIWMTAAVALFGSLAVLSKENGILLPLLILVLEMTLLRPIPRPRGWLLWAGIFIGIPILIIAGYFGYVIWNNESYYVMREFSLYERLISEARVLVDYLAKIVVPISTPTIFNDDFEFSRGLLEPLTTLLSVLLIAALLTIALVYRTRLRMLSFSIFWFFTAHLIESTVVPLELYFEHRNYLPLVGPMLGLAYMLNKVNFKRPQLYLPITLTLLLLVSIITLNHSHTWGDNERLYAAWAAEHPDSIRVQTSHAVQLTQAGQGEEAIAILKRLQEHHPNHLGTRITYTAVACAADRLQKEEFLALLEAAKHDFYNGATHAKVNLLYRLIREQMCLQIKPGGLNQLVVNLTQNPWLKHQPETLAQLYTISADLHFAHGHYAQTLSALTRAYETFPSFDTALRKARIEASFKLIDQARDTLAIARRFDRERSPLLPSRAAELKPIEELIARAQ